LADEPTGDLDSKNGQMIMDLLLYFQRELKRTIVLVTHNLEYLPLSDNQLYILMVNYGSSTQPEAVDHHGEFAKL